MMGRFFHQPRVRCKICRREVAGYVPRGGTGDYLRPFRHVDQDGEPCEGRFYEGELVREPSGIDLRRRVDR